MGPPGLIDREMRLGKDDQTQQLRIFMTHLVQILRKDLWLILNDLRTIVIVFLILERGM